MRLKIVVWCSWHINLSYSLILSASKSVDKYNEQCLPQANSLRTKPAFSSEHRGPSQPSQFHFLSSFPSCVFSACPEVYCFWSLERRSSPSPGGLGTCRQPLIPLFSQHWPEWTTRPVVTAGPRFWAHSIWSQPHSPKLYGQSSNCVMYLPTIYPTSWWVPSHSFPQVFVPL